MVGVPGGSSGIANREAAGDRYGNRSNAQVTADVRIARSGGLIAYLHRAETNGPHATADGHRAASLEEERKKLRTEWLERQQKRIKRTGSAIRGYAEAL